MRTPEVNVVYGRGVRTGGPEAVHQLVHELRALGVEAFVVPDRRTISAARVAEYSVYDAPERERLPDEPGQVVVAPEVYLPELLKVRRARRVCWWLSIDNSPVFRAERYLADVAAGLADRPRLRELRSLTWLAHRELAGWRYRLHDVEHRAQSAYAAAYLSRRLGVEAPLLTDYIPAAATLDIPAVFEPRRPAISFNPAKGRRLLERVRRDLDREVDWLPIRGLNPDEVRARLGQATVYLDLGPHPGRDRMPREAAIAGSVTVVARRGSGGYHEDVGIPEQYKVGLGRGLAERAVRVVGAVLDDPAAAYADQHDYRTAVQDQERAFRAQVAAFATSLTSLRRDGG